MSVTPASPWSSNCTLAELADWLANKGRVVIFTHAKPDGDALGSSLALMRALNIAANRPDRARSWYWGPMLPWTEPIIGDTPVARLDDAPLPDDPDAVVILDTGTWIQVAEVRPWLEQHHDIAAVVDHHLQGDEDVARFRVIDSTAAAVCESAADLCRMVLGLDSCSRLPREVAEPLYLGLATDTGWFRYANVTPATLRLAAQLIEAGTDHARLYEVSEQTDRPARLKLLARALDSMQLLDDGRVALLALTLRDFAECDATSGESSSFAEEPLSIASVRVVASLIESDRFGDGKPMTKLSLRSKPGPDAVDVNLVAQQFGGGGHARAAGAKINAPLDEARRRVIEALV